MDGKEEELLKARLLLLGWVDALFPEIERRVGQAFPLETVDSEHEGRAVDELVERFIVGVVRHDGMEELRKTLKHWELQKRIVVGRRYLLVVNETRRTGPALDCGG